MLSRYEEHTKMNMVDLKQKKLNINWIFETPVVDQWAQIFKI